MYLYFCVSVCAASTSPFIFKIKLSQLNKPLIFERIKPDVGADDITRTYSRFFLLYFPLLSENSLKFQGKPTHSQGRDGDSLENSLCRDLEPSSGISPGPGMGGLFSDPSHKSGEWNPPGSGISGNGVIAPSTLPEGSFWILARKKMDINGVGCNFSDIIGIMG